MAIPTKVLFLCVGNSCRSQMAEAIARHVAADVIVPSSAGLVAFGEIAPPTLTGTWRAGISAEGQRSKTLRPEDMANADLVINMTGQPATSIFAEATVPIEDWEVDDPFGSNLVVYREIRDHIKFLVEDLARRLHDSVNTRQKT